MRVNETSAQKRIWALVLTVMMVIGLLPFNVVAADEVVTAEEPAEGQGSALYGTVTALTGEEYNIVGEVDIEGNKTESVTVTMTKMKLKRVLEDPEIGRPVDGWWAGIRVDAPDEITDEMVGLAKYKANGGEFQSFLESQDGENGNYWIGMWNLVNEEKLNACRADGTNLTTTYEFDWDGNKAIDQTITVEIVPAYIVLLDEEGENPVYPNYCSVCGEDGVVGDHLYDIPATCVDDGFAIYACIHTVSGEEAGSEPVACDGFIVVRIPATGKHTRGDTRYGITLPTCTESGLDAYYLCEVCGCYLDGQGNVKDVQVFPPLGHEYKGVETSPTCTEDGYITYTCTRCEDSYTEPSGETATRHTFDKKVSGVAATCREEGYGEYYICSVCGAEDPDHPKVTIPKLDHNLKLVKSKEPTCEAEGYNIFKCDKPTCVYGQDKNGFREIIPKLGHDLVDVAGKDATCTEAGYTAYKSCTRCEHTEGYTPLNALGHKDVSQDKDATCTEDGVKEAVVCERCGVVLHEGEVIPATGHKFGDLVKGVEPNCTKDGIVAHKICNTCGKAFAVDADESETAALESTVAPALGHDMKLWGTQAATCIASGLAVYVCDREGCKHTTSETLAATGHSFEFVEEVPADCTNPGVEAHNECTACGKLFAADADASDITLEPLTEEEHEIDALGHVPSVPVEAVNPTYDSAGNTAGAKCERCGDMVEGKILDELEEAVKFHYVISGVNGAEAAVNSGYVTLEIYFDVLADADDKEEYNSDVLANIFGIDLTMNYNKEVFELTNVQVAPGAFAKAEFTPYATANENGAFTIAQDMVKVNNSKVFRGENNLFATLTFQVNVEAAKGDYAFTLDETKGINVAHPEDETVGTSASDETVVITVRTLGDANGDGLYNVADSLMLSDYIRNPDIEKAYIPEYDMDKDGNIDFIDLDLLRKAIVGNNEYLTILVDPNEVAAEV